MISHAMRSRLFSSLPWLFVVALVLPVRLSAAGPGDDVPGDGLHLTVLRDFNGDGTGDLAEVSSAGEEAEPNFLIVSLGRADGTFQRTGVRLPLLHKPRALVSADFNKDGAADLIVGNDDGSLMLFTGDGRGKFTPAGEVAHLDSVQSMVVADFNRDGVPDLAVSDWRASAVKVLLGTGSGSFQSGWSFPLRLAGTTPHLSAADFNGDSLIDLAVVYSSEDGATYDVMLGDGHGVFVASPKLSFVPDPYAHCVTSN